MYLTTTAITAAHPCSRRPSITPARNTATETITPACDQTGREKPCASVNNSAPKWLILGKTGWRRAVQNFTPSWFAVTMGTGIVSILLHSLSTFYPGNSRPLEVLSIVFFILNVMLFMIISIITILRYVLYPATWTLMIQHPVQSLFLGTLPMGFATIINMFALVCVPAWGGATHTIAWTMWWIDVVMSIFCCFGLPWQMMTKHQNSHETMTAAWLLPIVSTIVAAASGAVVANTLPNPYHALWTVITSYVLWGTGVPMACIVLVVYFHRLAIHKLPPKEVIVSVFLPLGPLGQGGYGIMSLGAVAMKTFPKTNTLHPLAGDILYVLGFGVAIILWGLGLVWFFFAVASISRSKFPFNMGWWGFTFPIGVFTLSTLTMAEELPSAFFKYLGTVFAISVMLLWLVVAGGTAHSIIYGSLFEAPCLAELKAKGIKKEEQDV